MTKETKSAQSPLKAWVEAKDEEERQRSAERARLGPHALDIEGVESFLTWCKGGSGPLAQICGTDPTAERARLRLCQMVRVLRGYAVTWNRTVRRERALWWMSHHLKYLQADDPLTRKEAHRALPTMLAVETGDAAFSEFDAFTQRARKFIADVRSPATLLAYVCKETGALGFEKEPGSLDLGLTVKSIHRAKPKSRAKDNADKANARQRAKTKKVAAKRSAQRRKNAEQKKALPQ